MPYAKASKNIQISCPFSFSSKKNRTSLAPFDYEKQLQIVTDGSLLRSWKADVEKDTPEKNPKILYMKRLVKSLTKEGFLKTWKVYRWRLVAFLFCYYLVRDLFLYVFLPLLILKNF